MRLRKRRQRVAVGYFVGPAVAWLFLGGLWR